MRKLLACIVLLLIPTMATAQQGYAGLQFGTGFLAGLVAVPLTAQVGFQVTDTIDVRTDLGFYLTGTGIQLGANGLGKFDIDGPETVAYGGGGPRLLLDSGSGSAVFGLGGLGGAEYMLDGQFGIFGEGGFDVFFAGGAVSIFKLGAGVNFHF